MEIILIGGAFVCLIGARIIHFFYEKKEEELAETKATLYKQITALKSQKRGLETKYGYAIENLSPQLEQLKDYDPKNFRQMGQPIDYIYYGPEGIEFIEIKTGGSKLSKTQRTIRDQIKNGKVSFKVVRIKD